MTIKFDPPFFKFRAAICRFVVVAFYRFYKFLPLANLLPFLLFVLRLRFACQIWLRFDYTKPKGSENLTEKFR
jgi:hypothetical protein